jgi:hypothetical protein
MSKSHRNMEKRPRKMTAIALDEHRQGIDMAEK